MLKPWRRRSVNRWCWEAPWTRAHAEFALGRTTDAAALASRSLAAYQSIGYQEGLASAGTLAAQLAVLAGNHERAETLLDQALDVSSACDISAVRHPSWRRWPCSTTTEATTNELAYTLAKPALRRQTGTVPSRLCAINSAVSSGPRPRMMNAVLHRCVSP